MDQKGLKVTEGTSEGPLVSVALSAKHETDKFCCTKSLRVQSFLRSECRQLIEQNYCRVFVIEDPSTAARVLGYYTLSASVIARDNLSNRHQRHAPRGIPVPMVLLGFMGKDDGAPQGMGAALIVEAARRIVGSRHRGVGNCLGIRGGPTIERSEGLVPKPGNSVRPNCQSTRGLCTHRCRYYWDSVHLIIAASSGA